jgi:energy-coupling factor transporter ATP-binding protein EcfA2
MTAKSGDTPDLYADPFGERPTRTTKVEVDLLGARFTFESNSRRLIQLALLAYSGLPRHRLSSSLPKLTVKLLLRAGEHSRAQRRFEPVQLDMFSGASWLGAASRASDVVVLSPPQRTALVVVSPQTLAFPYHARYELIEFAVFMLASRCQQLASLHAACVGLHGRGVLLMGPSGSGKSTVTMLCLMHGFDFLAEDGVFVQPKTMMATGISNFLHIRSDSLQWLEKSERAAMRRAPVIRRRSGVKKFEVDLRGSGRPLARSALKLSAVVFLSSHRATGRSLLKPLSNTALHRRLEQEQAYAVNQPEWRRFSANIAKLRAFELRRGSHPLQSVEALRSLLMP